MVRKSQPARLVISPVCFWAREERGEKGSVRQYEAPQAFSGGERRASVRYGTRPAQEVERSVRMTSSSPEPELREGTYTHDDGLVAVLLVV
jgi:hypothetical protein